ncbi:hypothetical protein PR048_002961 [Dryococelus australis]|uniref:Uncharacterized protein n=1 Tax=Dryococelus australis TaxID=614101 RepID=A0ABQ9ILR3_9NEOP|nr:hypothetical protein PR048_002961 [Dryococelus australis]
MLEKNKTPTGSTSGLVRHLKIHSTVEAEYKKVNLINNDRESKVGERRRRRKNTGQQLTLGESFAKKFKLDATVRAKAITNKIACMMAIDNQPYSIIEDAVFRSLVDILEPKYNIPSRTTFSRAIIPALYQEEKQKLSQVISTDIETGITSLSLITEM